MVQQTFEWSQPRIIKRVIFLKTIEVLRKFLISYDGGQLTLHISLYSNTIALSQQWMAKKTYTLHKDAQMYGKK